MDNEANFPTKKKDNLDEEDEDDVCIDDKGSVVKDSKEKIDY